MSVLIKGMQMPELYETYKIMVAKTREGKIVLGMSKLNETSYKPIGEVIELPEHHGRIIDEDKIIVPSLSSWVDQTMVADAIMDAPTIIKAE